MEEGEGRGGSKEPKLRKKTVQINPSELANLAKERLSSALGKKAYGICSISPSGDGWSVEVEIVEEEHLISNYDVIGIYDARFDREGKLVSWSRKGLRLRG